MVAKIIVAGTRTFSDYKLMKSTLDFMTSRLVSEGYKIQIVSGGCQGADKFGEIYASDKGHDIIIFPADWSLGKRAGFVRNQQMAEHAEYCIVFWDGKSKGSKLMIDIATDHRLKLKVVNYG